MIQDPLRQLPGPAIGSALRHTAPSLAAIARVIVEHPSATGAGLQTPPFTRQDRVRHHRRDEGDEYRVSMRDAQSHDARSNTRRSLPGTLKPCGALSAHGRSRTARTWRPTIGTDFVMESVAAERGTPLPEALCFEERAGLVRVRQMREADAVIGAELISFTQIGGSRKTVQGVRLRSEAQPTRFRSTDTLISEVKIVGYEYSTYFQICRC